MNVILFLVGNEFYLNYKFANKVPRCAAKGSKLSFGKCKAAVQRKAGLSLAWVRSYTGTGWCVFISSIRIVYAEDFGQKMTVAEKWKFPIIAPI